MYGFCFKLCQKLNYIGIVVGLTRLVAMTGIDVGHQFFSRAEMVVLGLHTHWLNGIDFMGAMYSTMVIWYRFLLLFIV